ncbi:MAG: helix-turn-helix domain-containing protein [Planctomycetota bacterium]
MPDDKGDQILGAVIEQLRGRRSQSDLAAELGFSQSYWSQIERGERRFPGHRLEELASALGVSVGMLFELAQSVRLDALGRPIHSDIPDVADAFEETRTDNSLAPIAVAGDRVRFERLPEHGAAPREQEVVAVPIVPSTGEDGYARETFAPVQTGLGAYRIGEYTRPGGMPAIRSFNGGEPVPLNGVRPSWKLVWVRRTGAAAVAAAIMIGAVIVMNQNGKSQNQPDLSGMIAIDAGGWTDDGKANPDGPAKTILVDPQEVTNLDYLRFCAETGHPEPEHWAGPLPPEDILLKPVTHVTLLDAQAYAYWAGKRIPTLGEMLAIAESVAPSPEGIEQFDHQATVEAIRGLGGMPALLDLNQNPAGILHIYDNASEWTVTPMSAFHEQASPTTVMFIGPAFLGQPGDGEGMPEVGISGTERDHAWEYLGFRCVVDAN